MLDRVVVAIRKTAGVRVDKRPSLRENSYQWRQISVGVWHPESEEPPLLGAEAVASAMGLPEPATRGARIVMALKMGLQDDGCARCRRADWDEYSPRFEVEKVNVAAADDDDVDLEGDAALLRRCVDAGVAAARAYRRRAPRERSGQGGRGGRPRPPPGGRGRGPTRRGLYRFIGRPPAPAPAPAAPAPGPAAPAPPPPQPPANSSSDSSSSSSSDSDDSACG